MRYAVSDIHGNYNLFVKLLKKINFSRNDKIYILGDFIDKGKDSCKILKFIKDELKDNVICLMGNHELDFIKYFEMLSLNFNGDGSFTEDSEMQKVFKQLTKDDICFLYDLPYFIEEDDCIMVHAGVVLDENQKTQKLTNADKNVFVYDRKFNNPNVLPQNSKCVLFGHTPTKSISGKAEILPYQKPNTKGNMLSDYYKIQLDTGNYLTGVLGCFCLDTCEKIYVSEFD